MGDSKDQETNPFRKKEETAPPPEADVGAPIFRLPVCNAPAKTALDMFILKYLGPPGEAARAQARVAVTRGLTEDAEGVQRLMAAGCYREALVLSAKVLAGTEVPHEALELRLCRAVCLLKLSLFNEANQELDSLGGLKKEALMYEGYPDIYTNGETGTMVPFSLRVLHSELPHHSNNTQLTLDRLYFLLNVCRQEREALHDGSPHEVAGVANGGEQLLAALDSKPDPLHAMQEPKTDSPSALWLEREVAVLMAIVKYLCLEQDLMTALRVFQLEVMPLKPTNPGMFACLGRLHLKIGNVPAAQEAFARMEAMVPNPNASVLVHCARGFLAIAAEDYASAGTHFQAALDLDPSHTSALNNRALCWLYSGHLAEALKTLRSAIDHNPHVVLSKSMNQTLVANLCALYDQEGANPKARKLELLNAVAVHAGDDFDPSILKLA